MWSLCATLTLWRGAESLLLLESPRLFPNGFAAPMDLQNHLVQLPGQEWLRSPPAVLWSHSATLTFWSGADAILSLETLECCPNGFLAAMGRQSRLVKPPGQEWRRSPPAAYGRTGLLWPVGVAPPPSFIFPHSTAVFTVLSFYASRNSSSKSFPGMIGVGVLWLSSGRTGRH